MNLVVASSRGGGLQPLLPKGTFVSVNPGAGFKVLCERALELLPSPRSQQGMTHVYIVGGACDVTERKQSHRYKEYVLYDSAESVIERMKQDILSCHSKISSHGVLVIFATIPKFNLETYNNSLLQRNKTTALYHTEHYQEMQDRINNVLNEINNFICETNRKHRVSIPFLHTTIMKRRGNKKRAYYIYLWHLLYDGLHATDELKTLWAASLKAAIKKNRALDDSDEDSHSPKRSWRQEKRPKLRL